MKRAIGVTLFTWMLASCTAAPNDVGPNLQVGTSSNAWTAAQHQTQNWLAIGAPGALPDSLRLADIGLRFASHPVYGADHLPSDALAVDLDQDGDTDVVSTHVAYVSKVNIIWHENIGANQFVAHVISNNAEGAENVSTSDIDGDGDIDIVVASEGEGLSWYQNDGHQSFRRVGVSGSIGVPYRVRVADIDNDGRPDLVASTLRENKVAWYKNDGQGSFVESLIACPAFDWLKEIDVADYDGDHDVDIVLGYEYEKSTPLVLLSNQNGSFSAQVLPVSNRGVADFALVDFDTDGDKDIVASVDVGPDGSGRKAELVWYENLGGLRLATHTIDSRQGSPDLVEVGDLNLDGRHDVIWKTFSHESVDCYEQKADHSFAKTLVFSNAGFSESVRLADVDQDGDLDIVATNTNNGVRWLENQAKGVEVQAPAPSQSPLWLVNRGNPRSLEKGKSYLVSFLFDPANTHYQPKLRFGMAQAWNPQGPDLLQPALDVPEVSSNTPLSERRVIVRPLRSGTFYPSLALSSSDSANPDARFLVRDMHVTELVDDVSFRDRPLMVAAGQPHLIAVDYRAQYDRDIRVDLIDDTSYVAGVQATVPAGIGLVKLQVMVPEGLVDSSKLKWYIKILPQAGHWTQMLREVNSPVSVARIVGSPIPQDELFFKAPVYALDGVHFTQRPSPHAWGFGIRVNRIEEAPVLNDYGIAMTGSADVHSRRYLFNFKTAELEFNGTKYDRPADNADYARDEALYLKDARYLEELAEMRRILNRVVTGDGYREGDKDVGSTIVYLEHILAQLAKPRLLSAPPVPPKY